MKKQCIAMLLAGGHGSRLGILTAKMAKPAVPFGGKYRLIDFPLSNCSHSRIDTVGVLTQYLPMELNSYLGKGSPWDLDRSSGGIFILPPYQGASSAGWYRGSANAVYQNINFIEQYNPSYVLVLASDHIYKMDYGAMLDFHIQNGADATIAAKIVPIEEATRFGIMNTDDKNEIIEFDEKPKAPKSDKASMGIYIFKWECLREYLVRDERDPASSKDFGRDVLPAMLRDGLSMFAYPFEGYWMDVGTIDSLWEANMDLLAVPPKFNLYDDDWRIYANISVSTPHYIGESANLFGCIVCEGSRIYGSVRHSVVFSNTVICAHTQVTDSIIMPRAVIGERSHVIKTIVSEDAVIGKGCLVGDESKVTVIGNGAVIPDGATIPAGVQVDAEYLASAAEGM